MTLTRDGFHAVTSNSLPDDTKRVLPLLGNDDLKLCIDARGVMHDQQHVWGSHPPARITWTGRRHDRRIDRYNSNLFEWGFLDLHLLGEEKLPAVTQWRQELHPREGYVETVVQWGQVQERTISFVHLERNLIVFHRSYKNLPAQMRKVRATYTLCQHDVAQLPFHVTWQPQTPDATGIEATTHADGMQSYFGRLALFADRPAQCRRESDNRLMLETDLSADGSVTICLALADDLRELEPFQLVDTEGWMSPAVREVHREILARRQAASTPDPAATIASIRRQTAKEGFAGLFASHRAAWAKWFAQVQVELPPQEQQLRAALDTQLYAVRCSYTHWSFGPNPFNTSWGACYFWDDRFPTEGLMQLGIWDMPTRVAEFRRSILPYSTQMTGGRGAKYLHSVTEAGTGMSERSFCVHYEFPCIGVYVNLIYLYCRYRDDEATWRRFYPVFREVAEFYRNYLLIELPGNNIMVIPLVDVDELIYPVQDGPFTVFGGARAFQIAVETAERLGIEERPMDEWRRLGAMTLHLSRHLNDLSRAAAPRRDGAPANNSHGGFCDYELFALPEPAIEVDPAVEQWRDAERQRTRPRSQFEGGQTLVSGDPEFLPFWSWGSLSEAYRAATCESPDEALRHLRKALTTMMDFGALNESAKTDLSDVHHPWFTTAAGGYLRSLTRMLVYTRDEHVYILPGIPAAPDGWRDFSFTLPIHGQGDVTVKVQSGRLIELTLHERKKTRRVLHLPKRFVGADQLIAGARMISQDEQKFTVETEGVGDCHVLAAK